MQQDARTAGTPCRPRRWLVRVPARGPRVSRHPRRNQGNDPTADQPKKVAIDRFGAIRGPLTGSPWPDHGVTRGYGATPRSSGAQRFRNGGGTLPMLERPRNYAVSGGIISLSQHYYIPFNRGGGFAARTDRREATGLIPLNRAAVSNVKTTVRAGQGSRALLGNQHSFRILHGLYRTGTCFCRRAHAYY